MDKEKEQWEKNINKIKNYLNSLVKISSENDTLEWQAFDLIYKLITLYLLNKYKSSCLLYYKTKFDTGVEKLNRLKFSLFESEELKWKEEGNALFAEALADCINRKKELIYIPFGLRIKDKFGKIYGHANVLTYRPETNSIEHFEPHGSFFQGTKNNKNVKKLQKKLQDFVKQINNKLKKHKLPKVKFISSNICCPYEKGLQSLESKLFNEITKTGQIETALGYCGAWSFLFIELILKNPKLDSISIHKIIHEEILPFELNQDPLYVRKIIRGFVIIINERIEKYFNEIFYENVNLKKLYKNVKNDEAVIDFFIDIEMLKIYNKNYDPKIEIKKLEKDLLNKKLTQNEIETIQKNLDLFGKIDTLKRVSPPTPSTRTSTRTSRNEDFEEEGPAPKPVPKRLLTKKKLPRCPKGTRRNKKTGKCESINEDFEEEGPAPKPLPKKKLARCPNGTKRNKITGKCDPK